MKISFIDSLPSNCTELDSFLRDRTFECEEENTTDCVRWLCYYREFKKDSTNALIRVVLRFELSISDSPTATYDENHDLSYNDAFFEIWDRQMVREGFNMGEPFYDEETESLRRIGAYPLDPTTFSDIEDILRLLD